MGEEKKSASSFEAMRLVVGQNGGVAWEALVPYLLVLLVSALAAVPHGWGVWAARIAVHGLALWFILQMEHITGLIGLVGLLLLLL